MYRDAANWKQSGREIFANPDELLIEEIEVALQSSFDGGEYFIAEQIGVESVMPSADKWSEDDHCWHELVGLEETDLPFTDSRTLLQFVADVKKCGKNWETF